MPRSKSPMGMTRDEHGAAHQEHSDAAVALMSELSKLEKAAASADTPELARKVTAKVGQKRRALVEEMTAASAHLALSMVLNEVET